MPTTRGPIAGERNLALPSREPRTGPVSGPAVTRASAPQSCAGTSRAGTVQDPNAAVLAHGRARRWP
jgi:hypothetical protein